MTQTAIVTGAASGMGRSTALLLAAQGWRVIALDRAKHAPSDERELLDYFEVDIVQRTEVRSAIEAGLSSPERELRLVANVAGIYPPSTLADFTEALYRQTFDVNVLGLLNVVAEASSHLEPGAAIVNFASVDAFAVSPGQLIYGASKAAVVMLTKELALELAPRGIRVNAIAPGWVDTPGNRATGRMEKAAAAIPLGRVASPDEIAQWVLMLSSPASSFMTGETVVLSGGDVIR